MNADVFTRYEATQLVELLYAIRNGLAKWKSLTQKDADRVPEKVVSKPAAPSFFELLIPLFRFIDYPGGTAVLTPGDLSAAEAAMNPAVKAAWDEHLASRSGVVYQTKASGYLERRVSKEAEQAALTLQQTVQVKRNEPLPARLTKPTPYSVRVFGSELAEGHVSTLKAAAETGSTVPFKGRAMLVKPCPGAWNTVFNRPDEDFILERAPKQK